MTLLGFERRWLAAIYAAILPASDDPRFPEGAVSLGADRFAADLVRTAPGDVALGLRIFTWGLYLVAPLLVLGRFTTFAGLSSEERVQMFERIAASDVYLVRELPMLFKMTVCLGICGLPEVQRRIGIRPTDATPPSWVQGAPSPARLPIARDP